MALIVQKYGGTSIGSPDKIRNVARRIRQTHFDYDDMVVVVSAMGHTTDELISLAKQVSEKPHPREYDALVSTGENVSAALLAMALQDMGQDAVSLTGFQAGIFTEGHFQRSKIAAVETQRIRNELDLRKIVIVTGFQGYNANHDITTIGRGGSDTSAVVIAASLGCKLCEIYTDVDGVYTTDPRLVKQARKLAEISYDEMLELASLGAKVLHPRAVEIAKENDVELHVRSTFNNQKGTLVKEASHMEIQNPVTGAALNADESIISIQRVPDTPGVAGLVFTRLGDAGINVDMIIQSVEQNAINNITFTVSNNDAELAEKITAEAAKEIGADGVRREDNIAKLSIVGVGMISKPGIAAKMFEVLGENGINIHLISTSEIKISCVINKKEGKRALLLVHKAFELEKD
ncbi:aspartate kinase [Thermoproteota archaeon]